MIKKNLSPLEINQLKKIGNPGIVFLNSSEKSLSTTQYFSHLVGFKINNLKSKFERNFDNVLSNGKDIKLTVDLKIQNIVRDELIKGLDSFKAKICTICCDECKKW